MAIFKSLTVFRCHPLTIQTTGQKRHGRRRCELALLCPPRDAQRRPPRPPRRPYPVLRRRESHDEKYPEKTAARVRETVDAARKPQSRQPPDSQRTHPTTRSVRQLRLRCVSATTSRGSQFRAARDDPRAQISTDSRAHGTAPTTSHGSHGCHRSSTDDKSGSEPSSTKHCQ